MEKRLGEVCWLYRSLAALEIALELAGANSGRFLGSYLHSTGHLLAGRVLSLHFRHLPYHHCHCSAFHDDRSLHGIFLHSPEQSGNKLFLQGVMVCK